MGARDKRYVFDKFAQDLADNSFHRLTALRKQLVKPIHKLVFWKDAVESFIPWQMHVYYPHRERHPRMDLKIDFSVPDSYIPSHVDRIRQQDKVIPEISRQFNVALDWNLGLELLPSMLNFELDLALIRVAPRLVKEGIAFSTGYVTYRGDPDETWPMGDPDSKFWAKVIRKELRANFKDSKAIRPFAKICYEAVAKQEWLCNLF